MSHQEAALPAARTAAVNATGDASPQPTFEVIETAADSTRATIQLLGEMDLATADLLTAALDRQLAAGRRFIRLDVSGLRFMDCAGLHALLSAHNRFLAARGTLVLMGVGTRIARLLSLTHLEGALLVADPSSRSARRVVGRRSPLPRDQRR
jgi:anti-sigma B factor antagonist